MTPDSIYRLKNLLRRELSSLMSYLSGAWPWSSTQERKTTEALQRLIAEEHAAQASLAQVLRKARVVPPTASFPMDFTTKHYLALDYLLPQLVAEQKGLIADLEADAATVDEEARVHVDRYLALKRGHLAELERLAAEHAKLPRSTVR